MRFLWTSTNRAKLAAHGVTTRDIEEAMTAADMRIGPGADHVRLYLSGTVGARMLQVIASPTAPDELYVVTAYFTNQRRRRP